ncbi:General transcription factor II-I repeat domain-containing protein 2A [Eumeta japonica]|uniref:General transcription factor II-I repeat domain-containing protein 2A n=1 Tax=Eumeta variegata TaxID=151549 RepID=A0A4C1U5L2_EUMVA|nr:General transcription factor II-I repeat domain-containing protein 2A [Eumeta japonica]
MSKKFFDTAANHPNPLLQTAVSYEPPPPHHFIRRPRNVLSDPPDELTAEGNHAPTAYHADRPRQMKSSKFQFIGTTDNGQPTGRFGGFLVRESRTLPTHADESPDLSDTALLAIFIQGVNKEFTVTEELHAFQPLKGTTTEEDIFNEVQKAFTSFGPPWSNNNVFLLWFPMFVNSLFFSLDQIHDNVGFCQIIADDMAKMSRSTNLTVLVPCKDRLSDNTVAVGIGGALLFTVLAFIISKAASRRKLLLLMIFFVTAVSALLIDLVKQPLASMTFYTLLQVPAVCIGTTASYFVDMYPTSCSLGIMVARAASFASVNLIGSVIIHHCHSIFYFWSAFVFSGILVGLFLPRDVALQKTE